MSHPGGNAPVNVPYWQQLYFRLIKPPVKVVHCHTGDGEVSGLLGYNISDIIAGPGRLPPQSLPFGAKNVSAT